MTSKDKDMDLDDDYIVELLKQDAKNVGRPSRSAAQPKPNLRFLGRLIRETDNHNTALLAKEAKESRARLKELERQDDRRKRRKLDGRLTPPELLSETEPDDRHSRRESKRDRRRTRSRSEEADKTRPERRRKRSLERFQHSKSQKRERDRSIERDRDNYSSRRRRDREDRIDRDREDRSRKSRKEDRSRSPRASRKSTSRKQEREDDTYWERQRAKERAGYRIPDNPVVQGSDSDLGPEPLIPVRVRGRATPRYADAIKAALDEASEDHDVRMHDDFDGGGGNDMGLAREKEQWTRLGADRLRAAGFSEQEVQRWEKSGETRNEEDVRWAKKGEGREWDRGKVLTADGEVGVRVQWDGGK